MRSPVLLSAFMLASAAAVAAQEPNREAPAASPAPVAPPTSPPAAAPTPGPPVSPTPARSQRSLGQAFDVDLLRSLPMSNGVWSVFETIESTAILDRIESSGLYVGEAGLMGVRGSSWTQASWLLG
ncbi:MAG TPA: hypothetical protein VIK51_08315, partial [Vicinamibacteria bacterium]